MENEVTVQLRNPPSEATMWNLTLTDWDVITLIDFVGKNGKERLDIAEAAVFITPDKWIPEYDFPMRIVELSIKKWKDDIVGGTIQQLYYVQSYRPYLWDWDKGKYGDEPDPTYREVFIPDYGSYYFDVATEELYEAILAASLWPLAIIGGIVVVGGGVALALATRKG